MKKLLVPLFVLGLLSFVPQVPPQTDVMAAAQATETLTLDVACDCRTFRLNRVNPAATSNFGDGGDTFVVRGKIYPGGTIPAGGTADKPSAFGPDSSGNIGNWLCRGTINVNEAEAAAGAGPLFNYTQYFMLNDKSGLITESANFGAEEMRALIGGMGKYSGVTGESRFLPPELGVNPTGCPNFRTTFTIKK